MDKFTPIEKGILAALAYFDVFNYPLTKEEIVRWFYTSSPIEGLTKDQIIDTLTKSQELFNHIKKHDDWYVLRNRQQIIDLRKQRQKIACKKWRIAKFAARLLRVVPFMRMVAVCNTLAYNNAREDSDIDFFIIGRSHRLWTMRFFTTLLLDFARIRRKGSSVKDKICLSFYVTRDAINLKSLSLQPHDPHFVFWMDQFVILLDQKDFAQYQKENAWIKEYLPFAFPEVSKPLVNRSSVTSAIKGFGEWILAGGFGDWIEKITQKLQKNRMDNNVHSHAWEKNTKVIISDNVLKFHEQDRREEYRRRFEERLWEVISRKSIPDNVKNE
ncbi:MAG: hypothetical protein V1853_03410 [bacterium]